MTDGPRVPTTPETVRGGNVDPDADPVATVDPGDPVTVETVWPMHVEALTDRGVEREAVLEDEVTVRAELDREGPGPHWVTGPIHVAGASPGDVLAVEVRDVAFRTDYAFNYFEPGIGVLTDAFDESDLAVVRLDTDRRTATLGDGVEVPLEPFFGIMAVAPAPETGRVGTTSPASFGGNVDVAALGVGATVYLPVAVEGAGFHVGDGHAAQGDGEVDGTALETSLIGEFAFAVHEDVPALRTPVAETPTQYIAIGLGEDLHAATESAVRTAVGLVVQQEGLAPAAAYRLCSVAVDFAVSQAVNGTVGVHGVVPKAVFDGPSGIDPARFTEPVPWDP